MQTITRRLLVGTAAALLLAGGVVATEAQLVSGRAAFDRPAVGTGMEMSGMGMPGMGMGMGVSGMAGSPDAVFAVQMAAHHDSAVEMAQLAEQRAQRPEIRRLAREIERTQTMEISRLHTAAVRLGADPDTPAGGMGSGMAGAVGAGTDLADVPLGEHFDRAFLKAMIPHHRMGVHMARMVQRAGDDDEIAAMAAEMVRVQTAEIALMQRWLDES